jgi:hypothetical protein
MFCITVTNIVKNKGEDFDYKKIKLRDDLGNCYVHVYTFQLEDSEDRTLIYQPPIDTRAEKLFIKLDNFYLHPLYSESGMIKDSNGKAKYILDPESQKIKNIKTAIEFDLMTLKKEKYEMTREDVRIEIPRKDKELLIREIWVYPHTFCLAYKEESGLFERYQYLGNPAYLILEGDKILQPFSFTQISPFGNKTVLLYYFRDLRDLNPEIVKEYIKNIRFLERDEYSKITEKTGWDMCW